MTHLPLSLTKLSECPFPVSPSAEESLPGHCGHGPRTAGAGECGQWSSDHRLSLPQPQPLAVKPQPLPAPPPPRGLTLGLGIPLGPGNGKSPHPRPSLHPTPAPDAAPADPRRHGGAILITSVPVPTSGPTLGCSRPQPHGAFHNPHRPRPQGSVRAPASGRWRGCWGHSPGSRERCSLSDLWHPQLAKGGRGASRRSMEAELGWPRHTAARGQLRTEPPTRPDLGLLRQQPLLTASAWGSAPPRRARGRKLTGKHGDLTRHVGNQPQPCPASARPTQPSRPSVLRAVSHTFTSKPEIRVQWDSPAATPVNALPCILPTWWASGWQKWQQQNQEKVKVSPRSKTSH